MSSTKQPDHHLLQFDRAAQIENCILTFFSNVPEIELITDFSPTDRKTTGESFTAIINFGGIEQGFMALNCSEVLLKKLAASMLGDEEEINDAYLSDVLGETINILSDTLLNLSTGSKSYKISIPAVIRSDTDLLQKLLADKRGYTGSFRHETGRVLFKLVVRPADCIAATAAYPAQPAATIHQIHQLFSCPRFGHKYGHLCSLPLSGTRPDSESGACHLTHTLTGTETTI